MLVEEVLDVLIDFLAVLETYGCDLDRFVVGEAGGLGVQCIEVLGEVGLLPQESHVVVSELPSLLLLCNGSKRKSRLFAFDNFILRLSLKFLTLGRKILVLLR